VKAQLPARSASLSKEREESSGTVRPSFSHFEWPSLLCARCSVSLGSVNAAFCRPSCLPAGAFGFPFSTDSLPKPVPHLPPPSRPVPAHRRDQRDGTSKFAGHWERAPAKLEIRFGSKTFATAALAARRNFEAVERLFRDLETWARKKVGVASFLYGINEPDRNDDAAPLNSTREDRLSSN